MKRSLEDAIARTREQALEKIAADGANWQKLILHASPFTEMFAEIALEELTQEMAPEENLHVDCIRFYRRSDGRLTRVFLRGSIRPSVFSCQR